MLGPFVEIGLIDLCGYHLPLDNTSMNPPNIFVDTDVLRISITRKGQFLGFV
jgi:hypothetical protein